MTIQEIKTQVAVLMTTAAKLHKRIYGREGIEPTQEEREEYRVYREEIDREIKSLIPDREKLSIVLSGCAEEDISHYDIEHSLLEVFKPGEGIQYDSESGQFWVYVKPSLVQQVLRHIDYHFPGGIKLNVSPNDYATNPWFQNWNQAERYLETVVGA